MNRVRSAVTFLLLVALFYLGLLVVEHSAMVYGRSDASRWSLCSLVVALIVVLGGSVIALRYPDRMAMILVRAVPLALVGFTIAALLLGHAFEMPGRQVGTAQDVYVGRDEWFILAKLAPMVRGKDVLVAGGDSPKRDKQMRLLLHIGADDVLAVDEAEARSLLSGAMPGELQRSTCYTYGGKTRFVLFADPQAVVHANRLVFWTRDAGRQIVLLPISDRRFEQVVERGSPTRR